jgi:hypothetical protein
MASLGSDSVKLLMHWDIKQDREQEYFEFVVREWVPGITRLGLEPTDAWYTTYSRDTSRPQIMAAIIADDLATMRTILKTRDWQGLHEQLQEFVTNYSQKIIRVSGGFQL